MLILIQAALFGIIGGVAVSAGLTYRTWQFWAIAFLLAVVDIIHS